jgi:hypothetical protein
LRSYNPCFSLSDLIILGNIILTHLHFIQILEVDQNGLLVPSLHRELGGFLRRKLHALLHTSPRCGLLGWNLKEGGRGGSVVEHLPSRHEAQGSLPSTAK